MIAPRTGSFGSVFKGLLLVVATALLSACISIFPQAEPAQLYRFGTSTPKVQTTPSAEPAFGVLFLSPGFTLAAAGDRMLTVTGSQVAYIKDARWVTSAQDLFETAVLHAFDADQGPARLVAPGEIARTDYALKLDVRRFEAHYAQDRDSAPTIMVELHATLSGTQSQGVVNDHSFNASVVARDNRVGAIATAYDEAVAQVLGELVAWVDTRGE